MLLYTQEGRAPQFSRMVWVMLVLAALCIGRAAVAQNESVIRFVVFASHQARSPFQNRILTASVLHAAGHSPVFLSIYRRFFSNTVESPEDLAVMLINCICILWMLPLTAALRRRFPPLPATTWLAPLIMLFIVAFTYVVRYEQRFTIPYDFLSMLLFTVGIWAVTNRSGWVFLAILAIGIPNRETSVFLIPMWFWLEAAEGRFVSAGSFSVAGLAIYLAWRYEIAHILHQSSLVVYEFPYRNNLSSILFPHHWPQLFSIFGFLAIPMWMLRHSVKDDRLRKLWVSSVPFIAAALIVGVWRETRIFGELSALAAVTFAIQLEQVLAPSAELESSPMMGGS